MKHCLTLRWILLLWLVVNPLRAEIILPGTQPKEGGIKLGDVSNCVKCHAGTETQNGLADPYKSWQGGLMAQAARDPVFRAQLAIANQDIKGVGEWCIRCHSPRAWLEGASTAAPDGSALTNEYVHGVSCEACHHLVDPLSAEAKRLARQVPPGYGNGMMVVDPEKRVRGPYIVTRQVPPPHQSLQSPYHATSELCANCHNVSNPLAAHDVNTQPPHSFGHIERTYSEWLSSDFAKPGSQQTCQSCHYPRVPGGGYATRYSDHRDYFVRHGPTGGSTWVQEAIAHIWKDLDFVDRDALEAGTVRAREFLKTAAALGLDFVDGKARLSITNLTGHKLPTGYPEGRRMWINIRFLNDESQTFSEQGRYGEKQDTLKGTAVTVPTLLDPHHTRIYECLPGLSPAQADKHQKAPGNSFHFILNDTITKDNRIPPRGFKSSTFAQHLAAPVGAEYADGQYWDEITFEIPAGTKQVEARLLYQSVSWEYLKFLVEENHTDDWGQKLYRAWEVTGRCPPEELATIRKAVAPRPAPR